MSAFLVKKDLAAGFEGFSSEQLQKTLECFPSDVLDGLARHAAYQRNLGLFKAVMAADKGQAFSPNPVWAHTGGMFSSSIAVEADRLATLLLSRDAPFQPSVDSDEASVWHRYPVTPVPQEMRDHISALIDTYLDAHDSNAETDSRLRWHYSASLNLLLAITLSLNLVEESRKITELGPVDVQDFLLNQCLVFPRPGSEIEKGFQIMHSLLGLIDGGPELVELLRTSGERRVALSALNQSSFDREFDHSIDPVFAEPLLSCAYENSKYISLFELIRKGVISLGPARLMELIAGVRPEHMPAVKSEAQKWFSRWLSLEDLSEAVDSGFYKIDPSGTAILLCQRGLVDKLQGIASSVDWSFVNAKGLTTGQLCVWHVLNQTSSRAPIVPTPDQACLVLDVLFRHVDPRELLLRRDPKGSTLFAQVAKSGNLQALGHAMGLLTGLSSIDAVEAVRLATEHLEQRTANSESIKGLAKDRMRAWVAGITAREVLADFDSAAGNRPAAMAI